MDGLHAAKKKLWSYRNPASRPKLLLCPFYAFLSSIFRLITNEPTVDAGVDAEVDAAREPVNADSVSADPGTYNGQKRQLSGPAVKAGEQLWRG